MATAVTVLAVNMKANSDLSLKQFFCVKQTAADTADIVSAVTDVVLGVIDDPPKASGNGMSVITDGIAKAVSDGSGTAIAAGDQVGADANGRVVKVTTPDRLTIGIALDASTAQGTVIRVKLRGTPVPYRTPA